MSYCPPKEFSSFFSLSNHRKMKLFCITFDCSRLEYCYSFWFINILHEIPRFCFHPSGEVRCRPKDIAETGISFCIWLVLIKNNNRSQQTKERFMKLFNPNKQRAKLVDFFDKSSEIWSNDVFSDELQWLGTSAMQVFCHSSEMRNLDFPSEKD